MAPKKRKSRGGKRPGDVQSSSVDLVLTLCRSAREHLTRPGCHALDAELWASETLGLIGETIRFPDARGRAYADVVDAIGSVPRPGAREALLAFSSVGEAEFGARARSAAERIAGPVPHWAAEAGTGEPVSAWRSHDPYHDDDTNYAFEIRRPSGAHVLVVYIDNNIGGIPADAFVLPSLAAFRTPFDRGEVPDLRLEEVAVADAAARVRAAVEHRRRFFDPPGSDSLASVEALIEGHLRFLPPGVVAEAEPLDDEALAALAAEFLAAPEGKRHRGGKGDFALDIILDFGNGYNVGGPLRWSPTVAEIFLADWVGRKVMADKRSIAHIPVVLRDFVRFAGRTRALPETRVGETLDAIEHWTPELLARGGTPSPFANAVALARTLIGDDLEDPFDAFDRVYEERAYVTEILIAIAGERPADEVLADAAAAIREKHRAKDDLLLTLLELLPWARLPRRDDRIVAGFAGAWASLAGMAELDEGEPHEVEFHAQLEPYDWLNIASLVLDGKPVTDRRIGRCLTRSPGDVGLAAPPVRQAFGRMLIDTWRSLGHLDEDGDLTPLGAWAIPTGIALSWGYPAR